MVNRRIFFLHLAFIPLTFSISTGCSSKTATISNAAYQGVAGSCVVIMPGSTIAQGQNGIQFCTQYDFSGTSSTDPTAFTQGYAKTLCSSVTTGSTTFYPNTKCTAPNVAGYCNANSSVNYSGSNLKMRAMSIFPNPTFTNCSASNSASDDSSAQNQGLSCVQDICNESGTVWSSVPTSF